MVMFIGCLIIFLIFLNFYYNYLYEWIYVFFFNCMKMILLISFKRNIIKICKYKYLVEN